MTLPSTYTCNFLVLIRTLFDLTAQLHSVDRSANTNVHILLMTINFPYQLITRKSRTIRNMKTRTAIDQSMRTENKTLALLNNDIGIHVFSLTTKSRTIRNIKTSLLVKSEIKELKSGNTRSRARDGYYPRTQTQQYKSPLK